MDGTAAIEHNTQALKRILAGLVAMAGRSADAFTSPQNPGTGGGRREASGGGCAAEDTPTRWSDDHRPPHKGEVKPAHTLPRHLYLAILRLLRPAEAAARRLIIASARGLVVLLPPRREPKPRPASAEPFLRRFGLAVTLSPADLAAGRFLPRSRGRGTTEGGGGGGPGIPNFPLFDPPRRFRPASRRTIPAHAAPRILFPGITEPSALPPPPSHDDPIDATHIGLRLAALAAALDDIEGQAKRFARWKARGADAAGTQNKNRDRRREAPGRVRRLSPLRPGRPPGGHLSRYDPSARSRANIREVDEILAHAHALALFALKNPDTS